MIDEQTKALVAATLTAAILGKDPHTAHSPEQAVSKFLAVLDALETSLAGTRPNHSVPLIAEQNKGESSIKAAEILK